LGSKGGLQAEQNCSGAKIELRRRPEPEDGKPAVTTREPDFEPGALDASNAPQPAALKDLMRGLVSERAVWPLGVVPANIGNEVSPETRKRSEEE